MCIYVDYHTSYSNIFNFKQHSGQHCQVVFNVLILLRTTHFVNILHEHLLHALHHRCIDVLCFHKSLKTCFYVFLLFINVFYCCVFWLVLKHPHTNMMQFFFSKLWLAFFRSVTFSTFRFLPQRADNDTVDSDWVLCVFMFYVHGFKCFYYS